MSKPRWRNPDKRMARAVELRAQGWSLRRIGTELAVTEVTIRRDLARYASEEQSTAPVRPQLRVVSSDAPSVRHLPATSPANGAPECRSNDAEGEAG